MSPWDASELDTCEQPADTPSQPGLSKTAKSLIAIGVFAVVIAAYVALVRLPERNRLLVEHDLKEFALLYHEFNAACGMAPSGLADLESFSPKRIYGSNSRDVDRAPRAFEMVRNGNFVIIWDAALFSNADRNDKYVLGYESNVAKNGGLVMLASGVVQRMLPDEFNALPRIKTKGIK